MKKESSKKVKVCFAASSGGHYEQLMLLRPLMEEYDSFIVAEKTSYQVQKEVGKTYYLKQINRKELLFVPKFIANTIRSIHIMNKEKPDVVICTGVLAMIPICLLAKLYNKKLVFIESFSNITKPTQSGKFLYRFSDQFYVQWKEMLEFFPKAIYKGSLY